MKALKTEVRRDHLEKLVRVKPIVAMSELMWNALDADATEIRVRLSRDFSTGISEIVVEDNGTGISELEAFTGFSSLGGSWKRFDRGNDDLTLVEIDAGMQHGLLLRRVA